MASVRGCERAYVNRAPVSQQWEQLRVRSGAGCVCACVPHLHTSNHTSFLFFFYTGWNPTVLHSVETTFPSVGSRPVFYFLFIIGHWSMWCVQSASEAVSGSDQVVWPSGEPRGGQWLHCVTEVPLLSVTLPATETGRSKMAARRAPCWCLSGSKQASFDPFLRGSFSLGDLWYRRWEV